MNLSVEKLCNLGGCVLIFVLIALLLFKPSSIMSFFEGQNNGANSPPPNNNGASKNAVSSKNAAGITPPPPQNNNSGEVMASLPQGDNEQFASVSGIKTPTRSCYPQNSLKPDDLLPQDKKNDINDFDKNNPVSEGILKGVNFLEAGYQVGVNTVGQSLRNSNQQLRSEPANPQVNVSPWQNTTIGPDLGRRPLESGEDCYASVNSI
mgnify:CR=1 FL=1|jgi:hypothetical protein